MKDTKTIIEQAYSAFYTRDIDGALALMTPDVSWPKASEGGKVVGKEGIRAYWTRHWSSHIDPDGLSANPSAAEVAQTRVSDLIEFRAGKVARETQYFADPFEAAAWRAQWVERIEP